MRPKTHKNLSRPTRQPQGFALVVTLTMLSLLMLVGLGLLSLSSISVRGMSQNEAQMAARANARFALAVAIGQLQEAAGPDQRVTGTAELASPSGTENPAWTGVWRSDASNSTPVWLVSGAQPDPQIALSDEASALLAPAPANSNEPDVRAEWVEIRADNSRGRYAYWIADEGVKARVDLASPQTGPSDPLRLARSQSPLEPNLSSLDDEVWEQFGPDGSVDKRMLVSMNTVGLAATPSDPTLPTTYFHHLTTGGYGLPVNVQDGGLKIDLSTLFDGDPATGDKPGMFTRYLGGQPSRNGNTYTFTISDAGKFFLSETLGQQNAGPNWGNLFSYAKLWENLTANQASPVGALPVPQTNLREENWIPYAQHSDGGASDLQHHNNAIFPTLAMAQITFRLAPGERKRDGEDHYYNPILQIKPVIGLWNPHNVAISSSDYIVEWAFAPYFRLANGRPPDKPQPFGGDDNVSEIRLRDYWTETPLDDLLLPQEGSADVLRLRIPAVDFQPGEFRMFSVQNVTAFGEEAEMTAGWNDGGVISLPLLIHSDKRGKLEQPIEHRVYEGRQVWAGRSFLQDTHAESKARGWSHKTSLNTRQYFGETPSPTATSTWLTLKSGDESRVFNRYSNLWNGGLDDLTFPNLMPQHSEAGGKAQIQAYDGDAMHIATWRFLIRTTADAVNTAANQGLRGWADSNPRPLASSLRFDGSRVEGDSRLGWAASTNFTAIKQRGLISDNRLASNIEPPLSNASDPTRYQGTFGPSHSSSGVPHIVLYDVPRSPLVSIGQFQHAHLARYNHDPGYVVGNSYANPRIPLGAITVPNYAGISGFTFVDLSYETNEGLWDRAFFSTLSLDLLGSYPDFDSAFELPNPRMVFHAGSGDTSIEQIIDDAADEAPDAIAARVRIAGAFNVNSTSKTAWKALLSSMSASELPSITLATTPVTSWDRPDGIRFNRFGHSPSPEPYQPGNGGENFWLGWRELSAAELDALAEQIVEEVKARGPFLSLADFVNRDPASSDIEHQRKGALQAALDQVVNSSIPGSVGIQATPPATPASAAEVIGTDSTAAGHSGYLLQGDLLQSLAPILQARSDYFRIRTCGEALNPDGTVAARAWCEAFVQRVPEYVDFADAPGATNLNATNERFGRRFRLVSFRWLPASEL